MKLIINKEYKNLVPRLTDEEYGTLKNSIKEEGQYLPIIVNTNLVILDGYSRYDVCEELDIEPEYVIKDFGDKLLEKKFVIEANLKRRQLTVLQKAKLGLLLEPIETELARERMSMGGKGIKVSSNELPFGEGRDIIAEKIGLSSTTYHRAKTILEKGTDEMQEGVESGELSVSKAYDTIKSWEQPDTLDNHINKEKIKKERMYKDTATWNPFIGCNYECVYCKPSFQALKKLFSGGCLKCYEYKPHEHLNRLNLKKIPKEKIIFICDCSDVSFANPEYMRKVFKVMREDKKKDRLWFLQSKNPKCLEQYLTNLPQNTILLTTLETNRDIGYDKISKAPVPTVRYEAFKNLNYPKKIVTIEPIMEFDLDIFVNWIVSINPLAVFMGYNSHPVSVPLPEPHMEKTLDLIVALKNKGIRVLLKEMRKMAYRDYYKNK